jgi:hypothetical protein
MGNSKKWRDNKIKEGLCGTCGKNPPIEDQKECENCRNKRRERQKKEYHQTNAKNIAAKRITRKEQGLCTRCGKNKTTNKLTCENCLNLQSNQLQFLKSKVFEAYGGKKCSCCGETIQEFLMLDHIENDGAKHRKELGKTKSSGKGLYLWIIKNNFPPMFQVLCANCNWGKKMNNGICPHKEAIYYG